MLGTVLRVIMLGEKWRQRSTINNDDTCDEKNGQGVKETGRKNELNRKEERDEEKSDAEYRGKNINSMDRTWLYLSQTRLPFVTPVLRREKATTFPTTARR